MNSHTDDPDLRIYRSGMCDVMALALAERTGLPLGIWTGYYEDADGEEWTENAHAVVVRDFEVPVWMDVDGEHSGTPENLRFTNPVTRVALLPASERDVIEGFSMEEPSEDQMERARQIVSRLVPESLSERLVARLLEDSASSRYVGIVVLRDDGKALIIKRGGEPMKGKWACPGGHVEKGESDLDGARRELKEETEVEAKTLHKFDEEEVSIGHLTFYWTKVPKGTRACADDDAERCKWVDVDDLPEMAWDNAEKIREAARGPRRS